MKKFVYILILLSFFGFKNINAKTEPIFGVTKYDNSSKEKKTDSLLDTKNYPTSNKILKEKKIRHRGLTTVFYLFSDNCPKLFDFYNKELIFSSQTYNLLRLFSVNEKRGPPSI
ncbi:MAG: hypothetical protein COS14_05400 [Bacteroidetes bacterium CG02_land_8_20_14_3_00_31_25]|nr:hypothetical protein [Bacteroidota bacterium]PIV59878.1 MAG: hypothetical protein COS14_05400 [Bacteroidetes bacterium CG02_land_8_20_14_3_00_31_25]